MIDILSKELVPIFPLTDSLKTEAGIDLTIAIVGTDHAVEVDRYSERERERERERRRWNVAVRRSETEGKKIHAYVGVARESERDRERERERERQYVPTGVTAGSKRSADDISLKNKNTSSSQSKLQSRSEAKDTRSNYYMGMVRGRRRHDEPRSRGHR